MPIAGCPPKSAPGVIHRFHRYHNLHCRALSFSADLTGDWSSAKCRWRAICMYSSCPVNTSFDDCLCHTPMTWKMPQPLSSQYFPRWLRWVKNVTGIKSWSYAIMQIQTGQEVKRYTLSHILLSHVKLTFYVKTTTRYRYYGQQQQASAQSSLQRPQRNEWMVSY